MNNKILRAAIYIRVSSAEQAMHGYSLESQQSCLVKYASDHDMTVVGIYCDDGKTARKRLKDRKQIHALLRDMRQDMFDVVLFWKMDRWFRNVADFYKVQEVFDTCGVKWISVAEPSCNMDTRDGILHVNIYLSIGQNESDTTSERIKFNFDNMISKGLAIHDKRLYGFGYTVKDGKVVKDPDTSKIAEDVFRHYRFCRNKRQTAIYIRDTYDIHFTLRMLDGMLSNPLYKGVCRTNENYCEPYLTSEEYDNIQYIRSHNVKRSPRSSYLFGGLMKCPKCGRIMAGTLSKRNNKKEGVREYFYYRCPKYCTDNLCSFKMRIPESKLESYLVDNIVQELDAFCLNKIHVSGKSSPVKKKRSEKSISEEMERLNLLFQKGRISFDYYEEQYDKLSKELVPAVSESSPMPLNYTKLYETLAQMDDVYSSFDRDDKKLFWHNIIKEIYLDENGHCKSVDFF